MRVTLTSGTVWDSKTVPLPVGKYSISASVKGYDEKMPKYGPLPLLADHDIDKFTITIYPSECAGGFG